MKFEELCLRAKQCNTTLIPKTLVALDPGETTGYALFKEGKLARVNQLNTDNIGKAAMTIAKVLAVDKPDFVVFENYKVYEWKSDSHSWASLHTAQVIGLLKGNLVMAGIPYHMQMAQMAKQFCTDARLKEWNYYTRAQKHARDAVRHGCYYILFNLGKQTLD